MGRRMIAAGAALLATAAVGATPAQAAPAPRVVSHVLPTTGPNPYVADVAPAGDRVFVSTGRYSDRIVVTDATGAPVTTIEGLEGPGALRLSPDRRTLYVAEETGHRISAYDTRTLRPRARYQLDEAVCPRTLAVAGAALWFGYACGAYDEPGQVGRIDLADGTIAGGLLPTATDGVPMLAAARSRLLVADASYAGPVVISLAVGPDGRLTETARSDWTLLLEYVDGLSVTRDGRRVALASQRLPELATDDLTVRRTYQAETPDRVDAVAYGPDDRLLATISDRTTGTAGTHLAVLGRDGAPVLALDLPRRPAGPVRWSPDGRRLYVPTWHLEGTGPETFSLDVVTR